MISLSPASIAPPFSRYSHGIVVPAGHQLVFCAGQLGVDAAGHVPADSAGQARLCFSNIAAILAEVGWGLQNVVRINAFVTSRDHMAGYMDVRNQLFSEPYPASTLVIVSGFSRPEFVVEIEIIAAGPTQQPGSEGTL